MDEVLKAIVGLINTGGDLAGDALYLYFILKIVEPISASVTITGVVYLICNTIVKLVTQASR